MTKAALPARVNERSPTKGDNVNRRFEPVIDRFRPAPRLLPKAAKEIWRLQYGPCWCHGRPGATGSFDFVRTATSTAPLGDLDSNIVILSDRVIEGSQAVFLQVLDRVPIPRLVVATASCPAASRFWNDLPVGWSPIEDLVPIDLHVNECVTGYPEALMTAVLEHVFSRAGSPGDAGMVLNHAHGGVRDALAH